MVESSTVVAYIFVIFILTASFFFYKNQKYLTYVETEDGFDQFYMRIPPKVPSSIMENLCKWPMLPDINTESISFITRFRNIHCETTMDPLAFLDEYGVLEVSTAIMGKFPTNETNIRCSYRSLRRRGIDGYVMGDAKTIEFNRPKKIAYDQFVVQCHQDLPSLEVVYEKAFVNVPKPMKPALESAFLKSSWEFNLFCSSLAVADHSSPPQLHKWYLLYEILADKEHPSMAVLVFDSVSVNQFMRGMPQTWEFLKDNGFFTMNMHNEVNEDSDSNIMSIFTGAQQSSVNRTFLWDAMRERQCMTYISEEIGDFPSVLGKLDLNVEHDLRPFYAYEKKNNDGPCTQDGHVRESLESLKANGLFEDTVFAFLSNRGNTQRPGEKIFTARVEELSPLFSIKLPEKYLKKYYQQHSNIGENVNRLTTTHDVGLTLMDITLYDPMFSTNNLKPARKSTSLLRAPVSANRTCDDVSIPLHLCLCMVQNVHQTKKYPSRSIEYKQLFQYVKTEMLKQDCIAQVLVSDHYPYLTVLSLNSLVQHHIRKSSDWKNVKQKYEETRMNYVEITVEANTVPKSGDRAKRKLIVRMRFRQAQKMGFEPVGVPVVLWSSDQCYTKRLEKFCEMCYYSTLLTE